MALLTINNKAEEQKETVVDSLPPPQYCWDDDEDGRFSAATRSALLANCLLPIAQLSCAVPMAAKAGDALLLEPSTPERVSGFSSPVPVAVSGLQHDIQEYNEGENIFSGGKFVKDVCGREVEYQCIPSSQRSPTIELFVLGGQQPHWRLRILHRASVICSAILRELNEMANGSRVQSSARSISGGDGGIVGVRLTYRPFFLAGKDSKLSIGGFSCADGMVSVDACSFGMLGSKRPREQEVFRDGVVTRSGLSAMVAPRTSDSRMTLVPEVVVTNNTERALTAAEIARSSSFNMWCPARDLVPAMKEFNARQRQAVRDIGTREIVCRPFQKVGKRDCTITQKKMFYIDRVVVGDRVIPRGIPAFVGWTSKLLREREVAEIRGGGFGMGMLDIPLRETASGEENGVPGFVSFDYLRCGCARKG
nr:uncharacterized protein LOC109155132 isoform X1 [Ipomoea batatas]GME09352.1 uncharacterized protein LOC109155132 isoform X1 [Ipomoea batatas]